MQHSTNNPTAKDVRRRRLSWLALLLGAGLTGAAAITATVIAVSLTLAWLAATRLPGVACSVGYYGGHIAEFKDETPQCPVLLHFGDQDAAIPLDDVESVRAAHPEVPLHIYPAGHGFNCTDRASYEPESAKLARERTLAFLTHHMA